MEREDVKRAVRETGRDPGTRFGAGRAASVAPVGTTEGARDAWRRRVLFVGGCFQVAFGAYWLVRALSPMVGPPVRIGVGLLVLLIGGVVAVRVRRFAPRPRGEEAQAIERRVTVATVGQLAASFLVPVGIVAITGSRFVMPWVMFTIGVLLVWLHREVGSPFQGGAGWILISLSLLMSGLTGPSQTIIAGMSSAAVLLSCASAGFWWLGRGQMPRAHGNPPERVR